MSSAALRSARAFAVLALFAASVAAAEPPQSAAFRAYLERSGLRARLEGERMGLRSGLEAQVDGIVAQVRQQVPNLPDAVVDEFESEATAVIAEVVDGWPVDDALSEYAEAFERSYSPAALEALVAELESPAGSKLSEAHRDAMFAMTSMIRERRDLPLQRRLERLARQLTQRALEFQAQR